MKKNKHYLLSILLPAFLIVTSALFSGTSSNKNTQLNISDTYTKNQENRVEVLEKFFDKYNSPLKGNARKFVETADKYSIDYKLLPAISCVESTCGKRMIPNTYNPFGWGIYGKNYISFKSFDDAIETVGSGLNKNYFSKGLDTVNEIAPVYTPPNSGHWMGSVNYFMNTMEDIEKQHESERLKAVVLTYL